MRLWRISNHATLDGAGGLRASSRWHTRGTRVAYCTPNPAAALLEVLVHLEIDVEDIPTTYQYLEIEAPDSVSRETIDCSNLPEDWLTNSAATRAIGDEWLRSRRTALLLVPCVIVPETWNVLLNPLHHPDGQLVSITRVHTQPIDTRLLE